MDSVTFTATPQPRFVHIRIGLDIVVYALCVLLAIVGVGIGLNWFGFAEVEALAGSSDDSIKLLWLFFILAMVVAMFRDSTSGAATSGRMFIACDETGLTFACGRYRHKWPWREVESFEIETPPYRQSHAKLAVARDPNWKARCHALWAGADVNAWGMTFHVMGVYDKPLDDIAAAVKAFRARTGASDV